MKSLEDKLYISVMTLFVSGHVYNASTDMRIQPCLFRISICVLKYIRHINFHTFVSLFIILNRLSPFVVLLWKKGGRVGLFNALFHFVAGFRHLRSD